MAGKFVSPKAKESLMTDILVKLFVKDYKDVEKGVCPYSIWSAGKRSRHLL